MERMEMYSRNQYLKTMIERYLKARKKGKGKLLGEYCRNTGQNRKYVIWKIQRLAFCEQRPRKRRQVHYGSDARDALHRLWRLFDCPCDQRQRPLLTLEVKRLHQSFP